MLLALAPQHPFDCHAALRAFDPPRRIDEEHRFLPGQRELEPSWRTPVVSRPLLAASSSDHPAVGPRLDLALEFRLDQAVHEADSRLDETLVPLESNRMFAVRRRRKLLFLHGPPGRAVPPDGETPPRSGGPHQAAGPPMPRLNSPMTRRTEGSPRCAMTTRLPEPRGGQGEAYSDPVLTHRFC
jgi:hypothetical protein